MKIIFSNNDFSVMFKFFLEIILKSNFVIYNFQKFVDLISAGIPSKSSVLIAKIVRKSQLTLARIT